MGLEQTFFIGPNDPLQTSNFIKGAASRNFIPSLPAYADRADYDYIYYVGSFPQGSGAIDFPLSIKNFGGRTGKVTSLNVTPYPTFSVVSGPTIPHLVSPGSDLLINTNFNPNSAGEQRMEVEFTYETGAHLGTLIYEGTAAPVNLATVGKFSTTQKILVVAHVMPTSNHAQVTLDVSDYEVIQNPSAPPTVIPGPDLPTPLSWNYSPAASTLLFDTTKLTAFPTANDVYAKKTLIFKNETGFPIEDFKVMYRVSTPWLLRKHHLRALPLLVLKVLVLLGWLFMQVLSALLH
jgi:hypothetical protein